MPTRTPPPPEAASSTPRRRCSVWMITRRMVVKDHDGRRLADDGFPEHLARFNGRGIERSDRDDGCSQHAVFRVEQHHAEVLRGTRSECGQQKFGRCPRRSKLQPVAWRMRQRSPADFKRRHELRGPRQTFTPATGVRSSHVDRASPCNPPRARNTSLANPNASRRLRPLPSTSATSSLSPSAAAPRRRNFSRGRSSGDRSFIVLQLDRGSCRVRVQETRTARAAGHRTQSRKSAEEISARAMCSARKRGSHSPSQTTSAQPVR